MIADNNSSEVHQSLQKIAPVHLQRLAVVYVRQSTAQQVLQHEESTRLQYGLVGRAKELGWPEERILVIDDDLGQSASESDQREGFGRLVSEVGLDHVGIILGVEVSRLARSSKDWHQLLEVCALFGTLIGDSDGLYDPGGSYNDRLLLGLKGTMSEAEIHVIEQRLQEGKLSKARRGELAPPFVPIGYVKGSSGEVSFDPDEEVQQVVSLIFRKFSELKTINAVLRYLVDNEIKLGVRLQATEAKGQLEWRRPNRMTLQCLLKNPIYAGAYAYGRRRVDPRKKKPNRPSTGRTAPPPEEWPVLIKDRYPAYISWETYERNLAQMESNRAVAHTMGASRDGAALLQGLVVCGKCGARMSIRYSASGLHSYLCLQRASNYAEKSCQNLSGGPLDNFVAERVLEALKPAALELSLEAAKNVESEREEIDALWQKRLERASYEAERAERHYQLLEPENRLVARQLARQWEEKLQALQQIEEDYRRFQNEKPKVLSAAEREDIRRLAHDIRALWNAYSTTNQDRKEIIRQVIERVVVEVEGNSERVKVKIEWAGGTLTAGTFSRPIRSFERLSYYSQLCECLSQLAAQGLLAREIAQCLDEEGYRSPALTGGFSEGSVSVLLRRLGLSNPRRTGREGNRLTERRNGLLGENEWWLKGLAEELEIPVPTLYAWSRRGWTKAHQLQQYPHLWVVWADESEMARLHHLHELPTGYHTRQNWIEPEGGGERESR